MLCACFAASTKCDSMGRDSKQSQVESLAGKSLTGKVSCELQAALSLRVAGSTLAPSGKQRRCEPNFRSRTDSTSRQLHTNKQETTKD
jgi:hypothetical protein